MSGDLRDSLHGWCQRNREHACDICGDFLTLLDERDALAAKVARVSEIVDCMCGHPAGGGCVEATYREALRAALGDQP